MRSFVLILFLLLPRLCYSQVVFTAEGLAPVEVGEVVLLKLVSGGDILQPERVSGLFSALGESKFILMDSYVENGEILVKVVVADNVAPTEILPVNNFDRISTVEMRGISIISSAQKQGDLIYNDIPLIEQRDYILWIWYALGIITISLCVFAGRRLVQKYKSKKAKAKVFKEWIRRLEAANNLSSCSEIWIDRNQARKDLIGYETELDAFFSTLSPAQFKLMPPEEIDVNIRSAKDLLLTRLREKNRGA